MGKHIVKIIIVMFLFNALFTDEWFRGIFALVGVVTIILAMYGNLKLNEENYDQK